MHRKLPGQSLILILLIAVFCFIMAGTSAAAGTSEPPSNIEAALTAISEEEKEVLGKLFVLTQEIQTAELEEERLGLEIKASEQDALVLEKVITKQEAEYAGKKEGLGQLLRSYQRMGPGSYLEIIMNSESLGDFLRRVNILRDITRNTGEMLSELEESNRLLNVERSRLAVELADLQEKQKLAKESLDKKMKLKEQLDQTLADLKGQRFYYEEQLAKLQMLLEEVKPMLSQALEAFSRIIENGTLPPDALKISFSLSGVKAAIEERAFNELLADEPELSMIRFSFHEDKTVISLPEQKLSFSGSFAVREGHLLEFIIEEGTFYDMPLTQDYIDKLLDDNELSLDFKPLIQRGTIESVKSYDGYIELTIKPKLL